MITIHEGIEQRAFPLVSQLLTGLDQAAQRALHGPKPGDLPVHLRQLLPSQASRLIAVRRAAGGELE